MSLLFLAPLGRQEASQSQYRYWAPCFRRNAWYCFQRGFDRRLGHRADVLTTRAALPVRPLLTASATASV
jgi:hypothetical protein